MGYELIKHYYEMGLYKAGDLTFFVSANFITQEQADEITHGIDYQTK